MLIWLGLVACWAVDSTAWRLARERPYYRPLAELFAANIIAELTRYIIRVDVLSRADRPFTGVARLAFHVEQAAGLVWPIGVAAVALVVLTRRPAWPAFAAGAAVLIARIVAYPWLRGDRLAWLLLGDQVALVGLCAWACWHLPKHTRTVERSPAPVLLEHHKAALFIVALEASMLAGPYLLRRVNGLAADPFGLWWLAQIGYTALFMGLAIAQWRWTWRARRQSML